MPIFASIHLGKTAGTAFANLLIKEVSPRMPVLLLYGEEHPLSGLWNNRVKQLVKCEGRALAEICSPLLDLSGGGRSCVVQGHIEASKYLEFLQGDCQFLTWLRHPLQRICSHYYFWKKRTSRPPQTVEARMLFARVISGDCSLTEFGCSPEISKYYTRMLAPLGIDGLATVALTEHPRISLRRLSVLLDVQLPEEMPWANQTRSKQTDSYELTPHEESQILAFNMADMDLYNRALVRLTREVSSIPASNDR